MFTVAPPTFREMEPIASWVSGQVFVRLNQYATNFSGWAFPNGTTYYCGDTFPLQVCPHASFIRAGQLRGDEIPRGVLVVVPDLAVEVISPTDTDRDVEAKEEEYRDAEVPMVWFINPYNRSVRVVSSEAWVWVSNPDNRSVQGFPANRRVVELQETDELSGDDVLPGFRCLVAELFPPQSTFKPKAS